MEKGDTRHMCLAYFGCRMDIVLLHGLSQRGKERKFDLFQIGLALTTHELKEQLEYRRGLGKRNNFIRRRLYDFCRRKGPRICGKVLTVDLEQHVIMGLKRQVSPGIGN
jgi:hypothetical protein